MTNTELKNKAITWLEKQSRAYKTRPCKFRPKEMTDEIGGAYTLLGSIQNEVIEELRARGVKIRYSKMGNKRYFELL